MVLHRTGNPQRTTAEPGDRSRRPGLRSQDQRRRGATAPEAECNKCAGLHQEPPCRPGAACSVCARLLRVQPKERERRTAQRAGTVTHSVEISHGSSSTRFSLAWFSHGRVPQPDTDGLQRGLNGSHSVPESKLEPPHTDSEAAVPEGPGCTLSTDPDQPCS